MDGAVIGRPIVQRDDGRPRGRLHPGAVRFASARFALRVAYVALGFGVAARGEDFVYDPPQRQVIIRAPADRLILEDESPSEEAAATVEFGAIEPLEPAPSDAASPPPASAPLPNSPPPGSLPSRPPVSPFRSEPVENLPQPTPLPASSFAVSPYDAFAAHDASADAGYPERVTVEPWWNSAVRQPILTAPSAAGTIELTDLVWGAVANSPQVQALQTEPEIRRTEVDAARAAYDPAAFVESVFDDTNNPVGSLLTTGGAPRLKERGLQTSAGVRGMNRFGGRTELAQEAGLRDNNSQFFSPREQADMRMVLRYTHPLARGGGHFYNNATIAVASVAVEASAADSLAAIQNHVFGVYQTYWLLHYHRAVLLQNQRALTRLEKTAETIASRAAIEGTASQASRAAAAVGNQRAKVQRSIADLAATQAQLRTLTGAGIADAAELLPMTPPADHRVAPDIPGDLAAALACRQEVLSLHAEIRRTQLLLRVAENELRPTLNLVTESYVRGLDGSYNALNALSDQFASGRPSYSAGVTFLRPRHNSAARAIMRQRNLEMRQLLLRLDQQLLSVSEEIHAAAANLNATYAEYQSAITSSLATDQELQHLIVRWQSNPYIENNNPAVLLDEILDAESRLIQAENAWAYAQANYMIAIARSARVAGRLLTAEEIAPTTAASCDLLPGR